MNTDNHGPSREGMVDDTFIPLDWTEVPAEEMNKRSELLLVEMRKRRTTRHFSSRDVPKHLIERAIPVSYTHLTLPTRLMG